jgi:hypothetical protein
MSLISDELFAEEGKPFLYSSASLDSNRLLLLMLLFFSFHLSNTEAAFWKTDNLVKKQISENEIYQNGNSPLHLTSSSFLVEMRAKTYLVYENFDETNTCLSWNSSKSQLVESHGYAIDHCFPGTGQLTGYFWKINATIAEDGNSISLLYLFYKGDPTCHTTREIAQSVESLTNGCSPRPIKASQRTNAEGQQQEILRSTYYSLQVGLPTYRNGVIYNGYPTSLACDIGNAQDRVSWSYVRNNGCDPQIYSPAHQLHENDESRRCDQDGFVEILSYRTKDTTCREDEQVKTVTMSCQKGSVTGGEEVFYRPSCLLP